MLSLLLAASTILALPPDQRPIDCGSCPEWNLPQEPFRLHGDTYYVGTRGLSALLVDTGAGLVLLDAALPQSAAQIAANIEALGFRVADVEWILNSHAHFDHAGGIAALQRLSGARVGASAAAVPMLKRGELPPDDPQHGLGASMHFPPVADAEAIPDGARVALGDVEIVRHATPGHTPGGSSWSWRSCEDGECVTVVYADSLSPVSAEGFRFHERSTGTTTTAQQLRASVQRVGALPCDLLVSTHPDASALFERKAMAAESPDANPFVAADACRSYAARNLAWLERRLAEEAAPTPTAPR